MQTQVREFHEALGVPVNNKPVVSIDLKRLELRAKLILEEALETIEAMGFDAVIPLGGKGCLLPRNDYKFSLAEIADGLTDLKYVTFGADIELGLDAETCFDEVQNSNMSKMWTENERLDYLKTADDLVFTATCLLGEYQTDRFDERIYSVKRKDGKIIKSPSYSPADLSSVISKQMALNA